MIKLDCGKIARGDWNRNKALIGFDWELKEETDWGGRGYWVKASIDIEKRKSELIEGKLRSSKALSEKVSDGESKALRGIVRLSNASLWDSN